MGQTKPPPAAGEAGEKPGGLSPGLGAFLRGGGGIEKPETQSELPSAGVGEPPRPSRQNDGGDGQAASETGAPPEAGQIAGGKRLFRGSLVVADLLLVGLAARLAIKAHGHLGVGEVALC